MLSAKSQNPYTQSREPKLFGYDREFALESGGSLPCLNISYTVHGTLNAKKDNVVWVFHALTANADPLEWWPGITGAGRIINPDEHYIVCANMLGSCYGTTGPESIDPNTGKKYGLNFPLITVKDMVSAHQLLKEHLQIDNIKLGIGGSMGGQQVLEWAIKSPELFENLYLIATNAYHSPWGIAFNAAQRLALEADPTLSSGHSGAGGRGLKAARAIAMLSYRNATTYLKTQSDTEDKLEGFRAESYQTYQGDKLVKRFSPQSYWTLSKAMDSHNVGRGRSSIGEALARIKARVIVAGIESDILFPCQEQRFMADHIEGAVFQSIDSLYGHDGFLIESEKIATHINDLLVP